VVPTSAPKEGTDVQTMIHYATPPGWRPRTPLPALRRVHTPNAPEARRGGPARPQPPTRLGRRPEPEHDDRPDPHAAMGLPWQAYLLGVLFSLVAGAVALQADRDVPLAIATVLFAVSLHGLCDYARAGARALREADR
jgi:hypothetical protein